jgi:hypothetical protein
MIVDFPAAMLPPLEMNGSEHAIMSRSAESNLTNAPVAPATTLNSYIFYILSHSCSKNEQFVHAPAPEGGRAAPMLEFFASAPSRLQRNRDPVRTSKETG